MNVATESRNPDRPVTVDRFDHRTEEGSAARNIYPTDLGCVDWYLYPVNRNPRSPQGNIEADLTLR
ncbi:MAG TPA: hypothetical protein VGH75_05855 [Steroidobacteraceae bacterium]